MRCRIGGLLIMAVLESNVPDEELWVYRIPLEVIEAFVLRCPTTRYAVSVQQLQSLRLFLLCDNSAVKACERWRANGKKSWGA
jgi:hypothetical protein